MSEFDLKVSMHGEARTRVNEENTALKFGSGKVDVFGTPAMVALMEEASINTVDKDLPEGFATVGIELSIKHIAATPKGMNITASAELIEIDGKRLVFKVEAFDEVEKIGEGTHQRFIIELDKFKRRAQNKSIK
ncbi:MAG: thioesterase family protein [Actinobacteria bacterium]|nr:thioesterase family protein [Actinomycetota bacterium]